MITLLALSCPKGDVQISTNDDSQEERKRLSKEIIELLAQGFFICLTKGGTSQRILGYDADSNEWILEEGKLRKKSSAKDTTATVVAPIAGG